jgi:hypothetical protein
MSTVFFNRIAVSGSKISVHQLRKDARRRLPASIRVMLKLSTIDLSFEQLFRLHPRLSYPERDIPRDELHYLAEFDGAAPWHEFMQARYTLEVKNTQIHEMLLPLSHCYPALCFVNSELCLDDGSVLSVYTRRGRQFLWELPERRCDAHWKAAAKVQGIKDLQTAYDNDEARCDAEDRMVAEGLVRWDNRVLRDLRCASSTRPV